MTQQPTAERILQTFQSRRLQAGSLLRYPEFPAEWTSADGADALNELFDGGYLEEDAAGVELTKKGERHIYGG